MGDEDMGIGWKGGIILVGILAFVTLLMTAGQCGTADSYRQRTQAEIEHLEQRLDNHLGKHQ